MEFNNGSLTFKNSDNSNNSTSNNHSLEKNAENELFYCTLISNIEDSINQNIYNEEILNINNNNNIYELKEDGNNIYNEIEIKFKSSKITLNFYTQFLIHNYIHYISLLKNNSKIYELDEYDKRKHKSELNWLIDIIVNKVIGYLIKNNLINKINFMKKIYDEEFDKRLLLLNILPETVEESIFNYLKKPEFTINEEFTNKNKNLDITLNIGKYVLNIILLNKSFDFCISIYQYNNELNKKDILESNLKDTQIKKKLINSKIVNTLCIDLIKNNDSINKIIEIICEYC